MCCLSSKTDGSFQNPFLMVCGNIVSNKHTACWVRNESVNLFHWQWFPVISWTSFIPISLTSEQELMLDDVVSSCTTVLGERVSYSVVKTSLRLRSVPSGRTHNRSLKSGGVSRVSRAVGWFFFVGYSSTDRLCSSRNLVQFMSVRKSSQQTAWQLCHPCST